MIDIVKGRNIIRLSTDYMPIQESVREHFDTYFFAVEPTQEGDFLVADFSVPSWHVHNFNHLKFMMPNVPEEMSTLAAYKDNFPTVKHLAFDVGAYSGVTTYEFARSFDRVVAFEPDMFNLKCLCANIEYHELDNVTLVTAAMSAVTGRARFFAEGSSGSRLALPEYTRGTLVDVYTISLNDACHRYGVPDYIKMDIEGAEVAVLDSSRELLTRENIDIVVDTAHDAAHGYTFGRVEEILRSCGYTVETTQPDGFYLTTARK